MNFFILSFILLIIAFFASHYYKESFEESTCDQQTNCQTCANANGCSWCPQTNACLKSTSLTTENPDCNQNNTISAAFSCPSAETKQPDVPTSLTSDSMYENQIADRVKPPNAYSNPNMEYSNETVMAELHDVRELIKSGQAKLDQQASSVQQPIKEYEQVGHTYASA